MRTKVFAFAAVGLVFVAASDSAAGPPRNEASITTVAFNVLAPCWASPHLYPPASWPHLDRVKRRAVILQFLDSVRAGTDILALQETTDTEFAFFAAHLQRDYVAFDVRHAPTYWSNWITVDPPYEPNGNAIFVKRSSFTNISFADVPLTDDGNHAAYFEGVTTSTPSRTVRALSVHLDSDHAYNRKAELDAALAHLAPRSGTVDILAGDFNAETSTGNLAQSLARARFVDVLGTLGLEEPTSPYASTYYASNNWGVIDHVVVRNATPQTGAVFDFGMWAEFPPSSTAVEAQRIAANLQRGSGSDHFPLTATAKIR